ncbi:DNA polymerase epsilon p17 subunit [Loa loa]|uniref:DNA polymerase epsilon subunit 3 n=1 Tax=Loa loa TaxID=7209 RepID=A0A1I7VQ77_LOALO|nr:DNA polymerase epsilon p17 subunit [Loa loa]EFO18927.1 DNA polymerase epsilon p17 subunit [Loa loa]
MTDGDVAEDLRLPQTVIGRLVKEALPPGVIISKDARTAIARAAAVFILHAATYAQECAVSSKRKTVAAVDVLNAVRVLECEELEKPVKEAVEIWKANRQQRNEEAKKRKAGRVQNNDPAVLEILKNVSQRGGISVSGHVNSTDNTVASDEPETKKMLLDVIMDDES